MSLAAMFHNPFIAFLPEEIITKWARVRHIDDAVIEKQPEAIRGLIRFSPQSDLNVR